MIIRSLNEITNTERDVKGALGTWRSKRLILMDDKVGFSLHETTVYPGTVTNLWYKHHYEAVLCVEGECELTNRDTGEVHIIRPGDMYLLNEHDRHTLHPKTLFRAICVFNPPVTGCEDHDEHGAYPAPVPADGGAISDQVSKQDNAYNTERQSQHPGTDTLNAAGGGYKP